MSDEKIKSKIHAIIEKINSETFDTATISDFYSSIRWADGNKNWPLTFEISNFVAHPEKDRGHILDKINSLELISNYIGEQNLNISTPLNALAFPKSVFEALYDIHDDKLKKFYVLDLSKRNYIRNKKPDPNNYLHKFFINAFYTADFQKSLIDSSEIYSDFFGALNYYAGIYKINKLKPLDPQKKRDLILCILSVLASAKITTKTKKIIRPKFKQVDDIIQLRYGFPFANPSIGLSLEGAELDYLFCSGKFDAEEYNFTENSSDLIRSQSGDLTFVSCS